MKSDLKSQQEQAGHVLENNQPGQISIRRPSQSLTEAEMLSHGGGGEEHPHRGWRMLRPGEAQHVMWRRIRVGLKADNSCIFV